MQEVTTAYARKDLHTLLKLELEWVHREESGDAQMTDEKLDVYSQLLKEQVADLEMEASMLPYSPKYQPLVREMGPMGIALQLDGEAEARRLDDLATSITDSLANLSGEHALREVRSAIQARRRQGRT
jgi:hypothetical protein